MSISSRSSRIPRRSLALLWGGLVALLALCGCVEKVDWGVMQQQHSTLPGDLYADHRIVQEFVPEHDGLNQIEVLLVDYGPESDRSQVPVELYLCRDLSCQEQLARATISPEEIGHNRPYTFRFSRQSDSAGKTYYFVAKAPEASTPARATFWAHNDDLYVHGSLRYDEQLVPGDLYFVPSYQMTVRAVIGNILQQMGDGLVQLPALLALLLAPGYLLARWSLLRDQDDLLSVLGASLSLSVAAVPVLLLLLSQTPLVLTSLAVRLGAALLGGAGLGLLLWDLRRGRWGRSEEGTVPVLVAMFGILAVGLFLRSLHSFDLAGPLWIDGVHHTLLSRLIVERGAIPKSYQPYVEVAPATYHFGFQSLVAALHWLSGVPLADGLLLLGQLLSGLAGLPLYVLGKRWGGNRWAGLAAAAVPSALSLVPAYFVSWSRYTQLAGLVILPVAVVLFERLIRGRRWHWGLVGATAVAAAGLLVTHVRVAAFFAALALVLLLYTSMRWLYRGAWPWVPCVHGLGAALAALALTWPWLWPSFQRLWLPAAQQWPSQLDHLSLFYVRFGVGRYVFPLALLGVAVALLWRRREALLLLLWVALLVLMANPRFLGFEPGGPLDQWLPWFSGLYIGGIVDNLSVNISLYVAVSMAVALLAGAIYRLALRVAGRVRPWLRWAGVILLIGLSVWGAYDLRSIINPRTVRLTEADMEAMAWIEEHVDSNALFLINSYEWMTHVFAGTDGGYWIAPLTGRRTWPPPALYGLGTTAYVKEVNAVARAAMESEDPESLHSLLRQYGFTHVYLGRYGGPLTWEKLASRPHFRPAFQNEGVVIFAVEP